MRELPHVAAGRAFPARRIFPVAQEARGKPESEPLFAYATLALKEKARRKGACVCALREPLAQRFMSVKIDDRHAEICLLAPGRGEVVVGSPRLAQFLTSVLTVNLNRPQTGD